jgi:hypothetical protein
MAMEREGERERREREREMCGKFAPKTEGRAFFCWVTLWYTNIAMENHNF